MVDYRIMQQDIDLLRAQDMAEAHQTHSIQVAEKALEIARRTGVDLDMELIGRGALFHDLGKNDITMARYYGYHDEIQGLMD